jgi:hypothetical protein
LQNDPGNKSPRQATVPKNGADPIFNQHFTFKLPPRQPMDERSHLHLVVCMLVRVAAFCVASLSLCLSFSLCLSLILFLSVFCGTRTIPDGQLWDKARVVPTECLGNMAFPFDELAR